MIHKNFRFFLTVLVFSSLAAHSKPNRSVFDVTFNADISLQAKTLETQDDKADSENWDAQQAMWIASSNIDMQIDFYQNHFDANIFARYIATPLLEEENQPNQAYAYGIYPRNLVSRDIFKIEHSEDQEGSHTDVLLNKFIYSWGDEETRFTVGRQLIKYGEGKTFNPMNPFNMSSLMSTYHKVDLGTDGLSFDLIENKKNSVHLYLFGDKKFTDYDDTITRTIWVRGKREFMPGLLVSYILGEDLERYNYGGEVNYHWGKHQAYIQVVKQSKRTDAKLTSEAMTHYVIGFNRKLTRKWRFFLEFGKRDSDELQNTAPDLMYINMRNFISFLNEYKYNKRLSGNLNIITNPKSELLYMHADAKYRYRKYTDLSLFYGRTIQSAGSDAEYQNQRGIPQQFGVGLYSKF